MTTAHAIGQHTKARMTISEALERWKLTDPDDRATWILDQLLDLGWTPPRDIVETAPARPEHVADEDSPGRQAFRAAKAALATRPRRDH
jgi:hypothetical protein